MAPKRIPRPRDLLAKAKLIGDIASGQVADDLETVDRAERETIAGRQAKAVPKRPFPCVLPSDRAIQLRIGVAGRGTRQIRSVLSLRDSARL